MKKNVYILFLLFLSTGCKQSEKETSRNPAEVTCEYIIRQHDERHLAIPTPKLKAPPCYPWQKNATGKIQTITKEYFCCKGSNVNPPRLVLQGTKELERFYDCGGVEKHSLPLRSDKEFIYPILIELLNAIQAKTKKQVIITSGHRCPSHNSWVDPSPQNATSKHTIGAEVDFYVSGLENNPEEVIRIIVDFYKNNPRYAGQKGYQEFQHFEKETNTRKKPLYNKEIFIKQFAKDEGRNFDNRHPYPYVSIQVRFDRDRNLRVMYSWDQSQQFLRR